MDLLQERIEAGARFLDGQLPGWEARIDLDTLDMRDTEACVLGQLFEDYDVARIQLDFGPGKAAQLGFIAIIASDFPMLSQLWNELIQKRRKSYGESGNIVTVAGKSAHQLNERR